MSIFNKVARSKLPSNIFKDLTYSNKLDMQIGFLYPTHVEEITPGDIFFVGQGNFLRSQPMVNPIYHNFSFETRWFFVPNRLVWDNFESFITDQEKGHKELGANHVHPYLSNSKLTPNYLHDLLGLPPLDGANDYSGLDMSDYAGAGLPPDALPFRAYSLIWNEFFKDENTMDDLDFPKTDGVDTFDYQLQRVSWKKDYFTSALPFAQRGEAVQLIGRVILNDPSNPLTYQNWVTPNPRPEGGWIGIQNPGSAGFGVNALDSSIQMHSDPGQSEDQIAWLDPNGTLSAGIEYSAIRRANAVQRFLERSALGGNRYAELLLAHFGVRSSDASLQRPQYLGGGRVPINISPVEQTSSTDQTSPQGNLAGKGVGIGSCQFNNQVLFKEHGWLLGLSFIRPDADYCQGVSRHLIKRDRFDYYWPDFQNIGEQEIMNSELWASSDPADNAGSFGYQSRYAEWKWHGNEVHGEFRKSLRSWVAPREFANLPTLSKDFIECSLDVDSNFAVSPEQYAPFMLECLNVVHARRPMYYFNRGTL